MSRYRILVGFITFTRANILGKVMNLSLFLLAIGRMAGQTGSHKLGWQPVYSSKKRQPTAGKSLPSSP